MTELKYGIDTHMDPKENDILGNLLKIPFQKYRPPVGSKFGEEDGANATKSQNTKGL